MFTLKFTLFLPVRTRTRLHSNLLRSVLPLPSWQVDRQPKNWRRSNFVVPGVTVHAMCLNATHPQSSRMMLNCNCSKMLMMLRQIFYRQMRMGNIAPFVWFIQGEPLSNCKQRLHFAASIHQLHATWIKTHSLFHHKVCRHKAGSQSSSGILGWRLCYSCYAIFQLKLWLSKSIMADMPCQILAFCQQICQNADSSG